MSGYVEIEKTKGMRLIVADTGPRTYVVTLADRNGGYAIGVGIEDMRRIVDAFPEFVRPAAPEEKP